jgi:hypothetical protein
MRRPVSNCKDFKLYCIGISRYEITRREATVGFLDDLTLERGWLSFATTSKEHYEELSTRGEGEHLGGSMMDSPEAFHRWVDESYPKIYKAR